MYRKVTDYLEKTVKMYPDNIALSDENRELTFSELRVKALEVANVLVKRDIFKKPVAIIMEKGSDCVAAFLGAAYSGNFYTPIDEDMPIERAEKILNTLEPACIVVGRNCEAWCELEEVKKYPIVFYEELPAISAEEEARIFEVGKKIIDTDLLYVLFTSGSTGTPKGVMINHKSVIDYTEWVSATFAIDETDSFANQAPLYFDNSVLEIYTMLKTGCSLYFIPEQRFTFAMTLLDYLDEKKITSIFWVPSVLCMAANLRILGGAKLDSLKRVIFCGEAMPNKQLNMWRKSYPDKLYANLYGPTEITDVCTYYIVDREFDDAEPLPIGKPCENTDILVLNDKDELVSGDEIGELCVRGTSLSMGYYNNPEKTKEAFVQNPLNTAYNEIIYRTGDLVKYNEYGELIYLSRKDFQIKHRGYRIELGEIETAAYAVEGMDSCCCLYNEKRSRIVMFYTAKEEIKELKEILAAKVPDYMVPGAIKRLEEMPINLNGKIDRVKLKELL